MLKHNLRDYGTEQEGMDETEGIGPSPLPLFPPVPARPRPEWLLSKSIRRRFRQPGAASQFLKRILQAGSGAVIKHAGAAIDAQGLHSCWRRS